MLIDRPLISSNIKNRWKWTGDDLRSVPELHVQRWGVDGELLWAGQRSLRGLDLLQHVRLLFSHICREQERFIRADLLSGEGLVLASLWGVFWVIVANWGPVSSAGRHPWGHLKLRWLSWCSIWFKLSYLRTEWWRQLFFYLDLLKQWCDGDLTRTCWKDLIATLQIWYSIQPSYSIHYLGTLFHNYTDMNLTRTCSLCTVRIHQHLLEVNGGGNVWRGDLAEAQVRFFTSLLPHCQSKTINSIGSSKPLQGGSRDSGQFPHIRGV